MIEYHRGLLADRVRTEAYRAAIEAAVRPGDVVVDVGCGSGILSFFACEAGAARVYAIDRGGMAGIAQFLTRHLGYADRVTVLQDESTSVDLPERADVLVTETMGTLGLDENIVGSVIDARARLLRAGAAIVPRRVGVWVVPVELPEPYATQVDWWSERRYGFDFSPLRVFASNSIVFATIPAGAHASEAARVIDVDLQTVRSTLLRGKTRFTAERRAVVHGFGVWFDAELAEGIVLDSIASGTTGWSQGFLPLERPLHVTAGTSIDLDLETDDGKAWRWRGRAEREAFDQTTLFAAAPYAQSK
jgi:SAM-dependent methyltransferase